MRLLSARPCAAGALVSLVLLAAAAPAAVTHGPRLAAASDPSDHRASPAGGSTRNEPSVAVDPLDPDRVATAANDYGAAAIGVYVSDDGGRSFPVRSVPPHLPGTGYGSDPHLAYDSRGRLYAAYLSYGLPGKAMFRGGLLVARSDDGRGTWAPVPGIVRHGSIAGGRCTTPDFPALAIDRHDVLHVAWQEISFTGSDCATYADIALYTSRSSDGGRHWSAPLRLPTLVPHQSYLPSLALGPRDEVYVTYDAYRTAPLPVSPDCPTEDGPIYVGMARSYDGGRHFTTGPVQAGCDTAPATAVTQDPVLGTYTASYTGATYRLPASSNTAVDPRTGRLVSVLGGADPDTGQQVVHVAVSVDRGRTWQPGGAVPVLPGVENQEFPRIAAGPDGRLSLLWLAQLPGGLLWASHSWSLDGGRTWRPAERIAAQPSHVTDPFWLGFIGDYLGDAVGSDGRAHPVWTDLREAPAALQGEGGGTTYTRALAP